MEANNLDTLFNNLFALYEDANKAIKATPELSKQIETKYKIKIIDITAASIDKAHRPLIKAARDNEQWLSGLAKAKQSALYSMSANLRHKVTKQISLAKLALQKKQEEKQQAEKVIANLEVMAIERHANYGFYAELNKKQLAELEAEIKILETKCAQA